MNARSTHALRHSSWRNSFTPIRSPIPSARRASPAPARGLELVAEGADHLGHVLDEGERRVGGGEGRHVLARVLLEAEAVEAGHDEALGRREEAEEADHREAAVVDLGDERLLLALGRELLGEAE